jgi:hypothetical protein
MGVSEADARVAAQLGESVAVNAKLNLECGNDDR